MDGGNKDRTSRYPFDYDSMSKGDRIEPEMVEEILGERRKTYEYGFKLVSLVQQVERELWARGKHFTVCIRDHGISILTDSEASAYNTDRFRHYRFGLAKSNLKMAAVDSSGFAEEARQKHDKQLRDQGAVLAAIAAESRRNSLAEKGPEKRALEGPEAG